MLPHGGAFVYQVAFLYLQPVAYTVGIVDCHYQVRLKRLIEKKHVSTKISGKWKTQDNISIKFVSFTIILHLCLTQVLPLQVRGPFALPANMQRYVFVIWHCGRFILTHVTFPLDSCQPPLEPNRHT